MRLYAGIPTLSNMISAYMKNMKNLVENNLEFEIQLKKNENTHFEVSGNKARNLRFTFWATCPRFAQDLITELGGDIR